MEKIKDIRKGTKISNSIASDANLYLYNNLVYKLYKKNMMVKGVEHDELLDYEAKEDILNTLYKYPIEDCAKICEILQEDTLLGYGMEYYGDYKTLRKTKKIEFENKKIYIHKIIELYKKIRDMGYIYYDFHEQNVLVNSKELRLIDIDSCLYKTRENDILGIKYLNELVLEILFDCIFFEIKVYYTKNEIKHFSDILYSGLSYDYNEKGSLEELEEYVQSISKKDIKELKKKLPKSLLK